MNANIGLTVGEIFGGLAPEALKDFEALGHKSWYPPGTILFGAGEPCSGVFWLSFGQVSVTVSDSFGRCVISHVARPGEILGLKAVLCGEACGTTARTESACEMTFVSRDDLSAFLSSHADAAFRIVQRLSTQVGIALDQLRSVSTSNPPKPPN
jgi:CRP-like cAMP-binding protein